MLNDILSPVLSLSGLPVYLIVGGLVFAETAVLVGFLFPGETAVLLGGVLANEGHVSLPILMVVVVVAAITGDSVGYVVGRKLGPRLVKTRALRRRQHTVDRVIEGIRSRGPVVVLVGRFVAFLRTIVPGAAGMSGLPYRTFLLANAAGGVIWGVGYCLLGYLAGSAYHKVEAVSTPASIALVVVVVAAYVAIAVITRRRERAREDE